MDNVIAYQKKKVKKVGCLIEEIYLHVILNGCIAHVLHLMWEDIGRMRWFIKLLRKEKQM
jgi:hypothetical protein